jgi:tRNA nucleotidyltransferase (CCA-adding enzyme)
MTDTGWGQVPVVHPESGEVIGIVTRTDLLKTLTAQFRQSNLLDLSERLEKALPGARLELLKAIAAAAHEVHAALYIVGGFVRDLLLERPGLDFDLVVEGDAVALAQIMRRKYGGRLTTHTRFGTAKWMIAELRPALAEALGHRGQAADLPEFLDLITARTEFYTHPTALPTVERGSIKLDLHRRDFTINTLALRLDGHHYAELHDYWGGLNDLHSRQVRVLHSLSFVDDPTRILRAVRFEQRFGFRIETRTLELLRQAVSLLGRVTGDRIRHELDHILDEEHRLLMLERLHELGLLAAIHPALQWDDWLRKRISALGNLGAVFPPGLPPGGDERLTARRLAYCLWLIRLTVDRRQAVIGRLKIPQAQVREFQAAARLWRELPAMAEAVPSTVVARLEDVPLLAIYANCLATDEPRPREALQEYLLRWRKITPSLTGHDLRARGLPPGPVYGSILRTLRDAWLDGKVNTVEEERALFENLLKEAFDQSGNLTV